MYYLGKDFCDKFDCFFIEKDLTMFVILVYDVNQKRVARMLKLCRRYLNWVQNSVFEGEISKAKLEIFKKEILDLIDSQEDSVILYTFRTLKYSDRQILGLQKGGSEMFL